MQRWEYLTIVTNGKHWSDSRGRAGELVQRKTHQGLHWYDLASVLNELGEQGWEFVGGGGQLIFKRPKE